MERRYAQERVGSDCRAWIASPAANRVRGIVEFVFGHYRFEFDLDCDRSGGR
jgi:hypothetical protein